MQDQLTVRLPRELNAAVKLQAERSAHRPSDVVRLALQEYLQTFPSDAGRPDMTGETAPAVGWGDASDGDKTVQLRHVPGSLFETLKARAVREGVSLSDYLLKVVSRSTERPTPTEFWERLRTRSRVAVSASSAELVREDRDQR